MPLISQSLVLFDLVAQLQSGIFYRISDKFVHFVSLCVEGYPLGEVSPILGSLRDSFIQFLVALIHQVFSQGLLPF